MKETIELSGCHPDYLKKMSEERDPRMPAALPWQHAIRSIPEHVEDSDFDLTDASSEGEVAQLAAGQVKCKSLRRRELRVYAAEVSSACASPPEALPGNKRSGRAA